MKYNLVEAYDDKRIVYLHQNGKLVSAEYSVIEMCTYILTYINEVSN